MFDSTVINYCSRSYKQEEISLPVKLLVTVNKKKFVRQKCCVN